MCTCRLFQQKTMVNGPQCLRKHNQQNFKIIRNKATQLKLLLTLSFHASPIFSNNCRRRGSYRNPTRLDCIAPFALHALTLHSAWIYLSRPLQTIFHLSCPIYFWQFFSPPRFLNLYTAIVPLLNLNHSQPLSPQIVPHIDHFDPPSDS